MVASTSTMQAVYAVFRRYINTATLTQILNDLERVPGSKSFRDTIDGLQQIHKKRKGETK